MNVKATSRASGLMSDNEYSHELKSQNDTSCSETRTPLRIIPFLLGIAVEFAASGVATQIGRILVRAKRALVNSVLAYLHKRREKDFYFYEIDYSIAIQLVKQAQRRDVADPWFEAFIVTFRSSPKACIGKWTAHRELLRKELSMGEAHHESKLERLLEEAKQEHWEELFGKPSLPPKKLPHKAHKVKVQVDKEVA